MAYECDDCGMDFDTAAQLSNHKLKFCIHSRNIQNLEANLNQLKHPIERNTEARKYATPLQAPKSVRNAGMDIIGIRPPASPAISDFRQPRAPQYEAQNQNYMNSHI